MPGVLDEPREVSQGPLWGLCCNGGKGLCWPVGEPIIRRDLAQAELGFAQYCDYQSERGGRQDHYER